MKTERESIKELLVNWGVIKDGVFSKEKFKKAVGTKWIIEKVFEYGLDKEGLDVKETAKKAVEHIVEDVCPKCGKNPCECDDDKQTPTAPVEDVKPVEEIKDETPAEAPVDETPAEAPVDETPAEAPVDETPETPAEAPKKKSSKKK